MISSAFMAFCVIHVMMTPMFISPAWMSGLNFRLVGVHLIFPVTHVIGISHLKHVINGTPTFFRLVLCLV